MELLIPAILAIVGAVYAITAHHLMRGVLGLALFFIGLTGLFASLGAWYLAVGQLFLFVGGVVTLFVLAFNFTKTTVQPGSGVAAAFVALAALAVVGLFLPNVALTAQTMSLQEFGLQFFTTYGWIVNIALLVLFSAIISAQYLLEDHDER